MTSYSDELHLPKRSLGDTGILIAPVSLGTVKIGRDQQVKYPEPFTMPSNKETLALFDLAQSLGINCLDTAPAYGRSEERIGDILGKRTQEWVICTKVGEEFIDGKSHFDFSPEHTRFSIERSLKRLHRNELDIVLIHSDGNDLDIINQQGTLEVLAELKQAGMIRAFGMSTKTVEGGIKALELSDVVMATYNLSHKDEVPVLDYAAKHNKGIFIKKALASGHLDKNAHPDPVKASMELTFAHPGTTSITIGTINSQHLAQNVKTALDVLNSNTTNN
ncbi:MAG: aldo/keto reductase [Moraxellaceae bacterium]|nr:MAG: aldo/keto reductase [Moraxellaceae bacterium]